MWRNTRKSKRKRVGVNELKREKDRHRQRVVSERKSKKGS